MSCSSRRTAARRRGLEFELLDTGIFDEDRYFDVQVEYAKASPEDICIRIEAFNRGPDAAPLHLIPHLWFRNTWCWADQPEPEPSIRRGLAWRGRGLSGCRRRPARAAGEPAFQLPAGHAEPVRRVRRELCSPTTNRTLSACTGVPNQQAVRQRTPFTGPSSTEKPER